MILLILQLESYWNWPGTFATPIMKPESAKSRYIYFWFKKRNATNKFLVPIIVITRILLLLIFLLLFIVQYSLLYLLRIFHSDRIASTLLQIIIYTFFFKFSLFHSSSWSVYSRALRRGKYREWPSKEDPSCTDEWTRLNSAMERINTEPRQI